MRKLGMTEEEISDIIESDQKIDKGEKLFEQTAEQKQATKVMKQAERTKSPNYQFTKRERKTNNDKRELIAVITEAFNSIASNLIVLNPEREIEFQFNGVKYKLTLSAPRKQNYAQLIWAFLFLFTKSLQFIIYILFTKYDRFVHNWPARYLTSGAEF